MKSVKSRYNFDPSQPLSKEYQDAQVFNGYYKCYDTQTNTHYLLSHFKSDNKNQVASLFKKFTTIKQKMQKMNKKHLTQIHEVVLENKDKSLFLILDLMEGGSIMDYIGKVYTLDSKTAIRVIVGALKGLQELHQYDLVNSFINLQNIEIDQYGTPKLSFKCMIYKTIYLSPQFRKDHVKSKQGDFYSLGVCMYRLIYGQFPYKTQKTDQLIDLVKRGPVMQVERGTGYFPILGSSQARQILTELLHFNSELRGGGVSRLQEYGNLLKLNSTIPPQIQTKLFKGKYIRLFDTIAQTDQSEFVVLDGKQKKLLKLLIYTGAKGDIEQYVKTVINKYGKVSNQMFLKIYQYQILMEKILIIVFTYTGEDHLLNYRQSMPYSQSFSTSQIQNTVQSLISAVKTLDQPHQYLSNQTLYIKNGTLRIRFPPFKTNRIKYLFNRILSSQEYHFIAPEVIESKNTSKSDSWSISVIQYWMTFNEMPKFDSKGTLLINNKEKLPKQKLLYFHNFIQKNPNNRLDLFNPDSLIKNNQNGFNQFLSPSKTQPIQIINNDKRSYSGKISPQKNNINLNNNDKIQISNKNSMKELNMKYDSPTNKIQKNQNNTENTNFNFDDLPQKKLSTKKLIPIGEDIGQGNQRRQEKGRRSRARQYGLENSNLVKGSNKGSRLENEQINYKYKNPIIVSSQTPLPQKNINKFDMKLFNETQQIKSPQRIQARQIPKQNFMSQPQLPFTEQIFAKASNLGVKFATLQRSYTKPMRTSLKCIIALLFYLFVFYFNFFKTTGSLISSRQTYQPKVVHIRAFNSDSRININYTLVTKTPVETYQLFYNVTLPLLRDQYRCVLNDYSVRSNVSQVIKSSSFVTYQIFGFLFAILHMIFVCLVIARLDLCKVCSLCDFQQKKFYPLFNYGIIILAIVSLTSLHYLIYGGLYHLRLQPCLGKSSLPGLQFLMKNWVSSWLLRFIWIYIGIGIAYAIIIFFLIKPTKNLHLYFYIGLIALYFLGVGSRAIGKTYPSHQNAFGLSGELLGLIVGVCLFITDLLFVCFSKSRAHSGAQNNLDTRSIQQFNKTQEFFFGNTGIEDDYNEK